MKRFGKQGLRTLLEVGQKVGVDITPRHFYSEIPDFRVLRANTDWRRPLSMTAVRGASDLEAQMDFVRDCCDPIAERLSTGGIRDHANRENGAVGYGTGEAQMLYAFIRRHRPGKIVQVGAGVSTAVVLLAAEEAGPDYSPRITAVDPYPTAYLKRLASEGKIELLHEKAQNVDASRLADIGDGGLLFVDSAHTLVPGSEVTWLILEVMPLLRAGQWVHFHDIYFPYDYAPTLLKQDLFFRHESILLHGFLSCNERFEIAASMSMLHHDRSSALAGALREYAPGRHENGLEVESGDCATATYLRVLG